MRFKFSPSDYWLRLLQGADGSRQPSAKELEIAQIHGKSFYETVARVNFAWLHGTPEKSVTAVPAASASTTKAENTEKKDVVPEKKKRDVDEEGGPCGLPAKCNII